MPPTQIPSTRTPFSRRKALPLVTRVVCGATLLALAVLPARGDAICDHDPVLTPLATDTRSGASLFSLTTQGGEMDRWLVVLDGPAQRALLYPDPLADLRTSASHGPGPFLSAGRCGDDCFQPLQWSSSGWRPLGFPIEHDPSSTLHFTYDRSGAPWLVFHQLTERKGFLAATAFRWDGLRWTDCGTLLVQAAGSPAAAPDPRSQNAIVSGTGRFGAGEAASYWLPALPVLNTSAGGQVIPLVGTAAAFLTQDSQLLLTLDGRSWRLERWTPWANPVDRSDPWRSGLDYSLDRPEGAKGGALPLVWYDDRQPDNPRIHLTRWRAREGWQRGPSLKPTTPSGGTIEHVVVAADGSWLLIGSCRSAGTSSWLEGLFVAPGAVTAQPVRIPLAAGWTD
jgi:hypothetical protein